MDSKANTYSLVTSSADSEEPIVGYSLKKYRLKQWIYANNHTQSSVAKAMGLQPNEFKRKLSENEKFNRDQLRKFIKLMGAKEVFNILYFPTVQMREEVRQKVFGKYKNKEELNE